MSQFLINAAFRSSREHEVYIFFKNEFALINYAPGTKGDRVVNGPLLISDGFPSLRGTPFGKYGIDCALTTHYPNQCFIFYGIICAKIDMLQSRQTRIFVDCKIANSVWKWVSKWWCFDDYPKSLTCLISWADSTNLNRSTKCCFDAVIQTTLWLLWKFRNTTCFGTKHPSKDAIENDIIVHSHTWISNRNSKDRPCWLDWIVNPKTGTTNDKILKGPSMISYVFPALKGTVFETGIDAAFVSSRKDEAYLFKGNLYALINYSDNNPKLSNIKDISEGFPSLKGTIFDKGIDAAFASHRFNEAYIFKGDTYALINFAPGTTGDYIVNGPKKTLPNWPSLANILPRPSYR